MPLFSWFQDADGQVDLDRAATAATLRDMWPSIHHPWTDNLVDLVANLPKPQVSKDATKVVQHHQPVLCDTTSPSLTP